MNQENFKSLCENLNHDCVAMLIAKGAEYSSDVDRLSNFKKNADRLGLNPLQVWSVYAFKHMDAIESYVKKVSKGNELNYTLGDFMTVVNKELSEPIEGRFLDAINYLYLGFALIQELQSYPREVAPLVDDDGPL